MKNGEDIHDLIHVWTQLATTISLEFVETWNSRRSGFKIGQFKSLFGGIGKVEWTFSFCGPHVFNQNYIGRLQWLHMTETHKSILIPDISRSWVILGKRSNSDRISSGLWFGTSQDAEATETAAGCLWLHGWTGFDFAASEWFWMQSRMPIFKTKPGWWLGTCLIFPYHRNFIIPIDQVFFSKRGWKHQPENK